MMADSLELIFVGGIKDGFFFGWTVFGIFAVWCVVLFICRKVVQGHQYGLFTRLCDG